MIKILSKKEVAGKGFMKEINILKKSSIKRLISIVALACLVCGFIGGVFVGKARGIPFMDKQTKWSIGIYAGKSPFNLIPDENGNNPVLTAKNVTDVPASFVADPFMVKEDSKWYMFFEVMNKCTHQGDIGLATSNDGYRWAYRQIVLNEPFHLSYPYVFKFQDEYYMIPDCFETHSVRLYKAVVFPTHWTFVKTLISGGDFVDSSLIRHDGKWWLFASTPGWDILNLFYADELTGPWKEHPQNPVIRWNKHIARPGGRILVFDNKIIRFAQDDAPSYGNKVRAFEVTELTTAGFKQREVEKSPILQGSGTGWNSEGMHNIDPHQIDENRWIACVDGRRTFLVFGLQY